MQAQGIGWWLVKRAMFSADNEAVVDGGRRMTYRRLNSRVNRLCHVLQAMGLKKGDRCAILAYNCLEYIETIFAAAKLGVILVPLNWRLTAPELAFNLGDSATNFLIFDPAFADMAGALQDHAPIGQRIVLGPDGIDDATAYDKALDAAADGEPIPDEPVDATTAHIIMYTAGTTGRPKGAVLSQGASLWNAINLELDMGFSPADRNLAVLPMFHIGGIGLFALPMFHVGATVVIQRSFDPVQTLELLKTEKITLFFGVPAIFLFLIQHPAFDPAAFGGLRLVMSGGAPLPVSLVNQYHQAGIILQQGFGMSEAAPSIATLAKAKALQKAGSIGRALFHVEARIVDDTMQALAADHVGELVIRGPNLMSGYWNRPAATAEAFGGGWFHTGDLARMDADGDIFIVERKKDMFISGGENVYPAEVENAIYNLEAVAEAAVVGIKDAKWGEAGKAIVVLKPGCRLTADELLGYLKTRLARYKVPKTVVFADKLPRNAAGKVLKNVLRGA
jgi:fatty-acyl-CoA synthase